MKLKSQVALITGVSRGLGLAIARSLGAEGAAIAGMARPGPELDKAMAALTVAGVPAIAAPADLTRDAEVGVAVRQALERFGRLDMLVLNAGTWEGAPLHETTEAQWDRLLDLNLKGAFLVLRHALPAMIAARGGTIIGISSFGGLVGQPGSAVYAASKWGLRGLLESAALELKPHRIRVSIVAPHNINSAKAEIAPAERDRHLEPEDIASLVTWICTAPAHVSLGLAPIWPLAAGIVPKLR